MGKALLDKWVVDIDLAMPIFKLLLNKKLYLQDLKEIDL